MKRISFKDSGGLNLTQAVLSGRKTMTRRAIKGLPDHFVVGGRSISTGKWGVQLADGTRRWLHLPYEVGDVVAIQQAYKDVADYAEMIDATGWTNKMFVNAKYMPHHIRITDVRVERLQDISDEDCMQEGVYKDMEGGRVIGYPFGVPFYYTFNGAISKDGKNLYWVTPREAFATLIDKVSGRGTWDSNPLVWAYSFELVN